MTLAEIRTLSSDRTCGDFLCFTVQYVWIQIDFDHESVFFPQIFAKTFEIVGS